MLGSRLRGRAIAGGFIAFAAAAAVTAVALSPAAGTGAEGPTTFTGTSSSAVVISTNSGNGAAVEAASGTVSGGSALVGTGTGGAGKTTSSTGVLGKVYGPTSNGMVGQALNTDAAHPSIGVIGSSLSGNGMYAKTSLATAAALFAKNFAAGSTGVAIQATSGGNAIVSTSSQKNGVVGQASYSAPGPSTAVAGVLGQDLSTASPDYNAGVVGTSTNGTGVSATSTNNFAVSARSTNSWAVYGTSTNSDAVRAAATNNGIGVYATSNGGEGVHSFSTSSYGGFFESGHSAGVWAQSAATPRPDMTSLPNPNNIYTAALAVQGIGGAPLIIARNNAGADVMSLDNSGNLELKGVSTAPGGPLVVHRTTLGRDVITYSGHQSLPSIEDFGEAQLVNGQTYVRLDPTFAATIDPRASYLVFITPEGPSRGLYVTAKSLRGFSVRENPGGNATIAFNYRIVAKPLGSNVRHLPLINLPAPGINPPRPRPVTLPPLPRNLNAGRPR